MSMTWAQIRDLYQKAVGNTASAANEWNLHLTEGYRRIAAKVDARELEKTDPGIATVASTDTITLPSDLFSVYQVDDVTSGVRLSPEPSGMRGRSQYLVSTTGMPATGRPIYWEVLGTKMFLRPTPDGVYTIRIRYKFQPPDLTVADLGSRPVTGEHYDMAIVWAAAASYLSVHPDANQPDPQGRTPLGAMQAQIDKKLQEQAVPRDLERMDQTGRMLVRGFYGFWMGR